MYFLTTYNINILFKEKAMSKKLVDTLVANFWSKVMKPMLMYFPTTLLSKWRCKKSSMMLMYFPTTKCCQSGVAKKLYDADVLSNDKVMKVQNVQRNFKMLIADVLSNDKVLPN